MPATHTISTVAGATYALLIATGLTAEFAIRQVLITPGDAAATAQAIVQNSAVFRTGFVLDAAMVLADVLLAVLLFTLFRGTQPLLALIATAFRLIQAAVLAGALLLMPAAFSFAETAPETTLLLLNLHAQAYDIGLIFFAINSFAMGGLLWLSRARVLGALVALAGLVYLAGSFTRFLAPDLLPLVEPAYLVPMVAETGFALWLIARGLRRRGVGFSPAAA